MVAPGRVVVINGTSSAGKTTLAETFQEDRAAAGECWVVFGIDDFMPRLPRQWVAIDAWSGSLADDGVRLERDGDRARFRIGAVRRQYAAAERAIRSRRSRAPGSTCRRRRHPREGRVGRVVCRARRARPGVGRPAV